MCAAMYFSNPREGHLRSKKGNCPPPPNFVHIHVGSRDVKSVCVFVGGGGSVFMKFEYIWHNTVFYILHLNH